METQYHDQNQHQQSNTTTNLLRFRSAPSSLLNDYITPTPTNNSNNIISYDSKPQNLNLNNFHNGYSSSGLSLNSSQLLPPQYPKNLNKCNSKLIQRSSSLVVDKVGSDDNSCGYGLNLSRRCSSSDGFFNQLDAQNGYKVMRGRGSLRVGGSINGEASSRTSRLSLSHLSQIPEIGNENIKETISPLGLKYRNHEDDSGFDSVNGLSFTSWSGSGSETSHLSENGGVTVHSNVLSHHLSLPKTSTEMTVVEKLMHFQDMVPCKVRAKRGFATHPRSIAERVRRNRISERMRKLQDLVPNMDKQINTTDMLDLAVDYIKELQQQHKVLSDNRAKCSCGNEQPRLKF